MFWKTEKLFRGKHEDLAKENSLKQRTLASLLNSELFQFPMHSNDINKSIILQTVKNLSFIFVIFLFCNVSVEHDYSQL